MVDQSSTLDLDRASSWGDSTSAATDFRSDVITVPSLSMLQAISKTTLLDDVYQEDTTTTDFEAHIAALCGHEAGLFVITGTMANQLALRAHLTQPPHGILCDARSHIAEFEGGGIAHWAGAMLQAIQTKHNYVTKADIVAHAVVTDDVHRCPTRVISLENTLEGCVMPLTVTREITHFARTSGISTHLDGARLFEAVVTGAGSLRDYAQCFDSVALDVSKNLGALMGAVILGSATFIRRARRLRKSLGGGMRQAGVLSAAARVAVDETFGSGVWGLDGNLNRVHDLALHVGHLWTMRGGMLAKDIETNMVWVDLVQARVTVKEFNKLGGKYGVKLAGPRLVLHHQIGGTSIARLEQVFDEILRP